MKKYLKDVIDSNSKVEIWNPKEPLSLYLASNYNFFIVTLLGIPFLVIESFEELVLKQVRTQINEISYVTQMSVVVFLETLTSYRIKNDAGQTWIYYN